MSPGEQLLDELFEQTLLADLTEEKERDAGWDSESLRQDVLSRAPATPLGGGPASENG